MLIPKERMQFGPWRTAAYQPRLGLDIRSKVYTTLDDAMEAYALEDSAAVFLAVSNPHLALCQDISTLLVNEAGDCYRPVYERIELRGFIKMDVREDSRGYLKH